MTPRVPVRELAIQVRGVTYKAAEASKTPETGTVAVVRAGNIVDGELTNDDLVYVPASRVAEKQWLKKGDVLIATSSGSLDVIGKAARVRCDENLAFGAFCKVLRPTPYVDVGYFAHYFQTTPYRRYVARVAEGANINNLRNDDLANIQIPLPPMEEQRRIAAVLDAADALRAKRREALAKLDDLTRSVFFDMFGDPMSRAKQLDYAPLGKLLKLKSGAGLPAKAMQPGPHLVYGANGVTGAHSEYMFEESKIIIGRVGSCGCVHVSEPRSWITDNALYVSQISPRLRSTYLAAALEFVNLSRFASQAAQPLISGGRVYPVEIPVPPLDTQQLFEQRVSAIAAHRSRIEQASAKLDDLFASLQQRAFRGEL